MHGAIYDSRARRMLILARNIQDVPMSLDALRAGSATEAAGMAPGVYFAQRRDRSGIVVSSRILLLKG